MPLPLLWLGAAAVSALAVKSLTDDRKNQQIKRGFSYKPTALSDPDSEANSVAIYPTDLFKTYQISKPRFGSIVCCGVGGMLDHTGIWVDDDTIIELDGDGLIKPLSSARFTKERSGDKIFVACDSTGAALASDLAGQRAIAQIYQYSNYHMIENNCHHFIWQCFKPNDEPLTTFKTLNQRLAQLFDRKVYWDVCEIS